MKSHMNHMNFCDVPKPHTCGAVEAAAAVTRAALGCGEDEAGAAEAGRGLPEEAPADTAAAAAAALAATATWPRVGKSPGVTTAVLLKEASTVRLPTVRLPTGRTNADLSAASRKALAAAGESSAGGGGGFETLPPAPFRLLPPGRLGKSSAREGGA